MLKAFDLETHLISPGLLAPKIVCGSVAYAEEQAYLLYPYQIAPFVEVEILRGTELCGANIAYDFGCLIAHDSKLFRPIWEHYENGLVFDVEIASTLDAIWGGRLQEDGLYLRDGSRVAKGRYSLEVATREWTGRFDAKKNDEWRLRYAELDGIQFENWPIAAKQYPIDDAQNTYDCAVAIKADGHNLRNQSAQAHAAFCMHLGAIWGIVTDAERVKLLTFEVEEQLERMRKHFQQYGFVEKNSKGWTKKKKPLQDAVAKAYGGNPPMTDKGSVSTDRVVLEESGDLVLEAFAEMSGVEKISGTYLPALQEATTAPLCVRPNPILNTGRSSYMGLIQTMPRKGGVRPCFRARDGRVFSSVDYAAIEMTTLAQVQYNLLGFETSLMQAINAGQDIHCLFGAKMLGVDYETFLKNKKEAKYSAVRQAAKAGNFGFPGMMGASRFVIAQRNAGHKVCHWNNPENVCGAEKLTMWRGRETPRPLCRQCIEYAQVLKDAYLFQWPEMNLYWRKVSSLVEIDGQIAQMYSNRVRGGLEGPAAANTLFQGLAADGAKLALIKLTEEMYFDKKSPLYGSRLVIFAHDETILEIPEKNMHEGAMRQSQIMIEEMRKVCPDVKVSAEPALMKHWYKEAETMYDEKGRLETWKPKEK